MNSIEDKEPSKTHYQSQPMISIVIPSYNEEANIPWIWEAILRALPGYSLEIIFVDDGSEDFSWEAILSLVPPSNVILKAIRFTRNFGKEAAILAGLEESQGEAVIVMDADGQHPPEYLPEMVRRWQEGWDIVEMVKEVRQKESFLHRLGAEVFYWLLKRCAGLDIRNHTDFKLLSRKVVDRYINLAERNRFFRGHLSWLGYPSCQIPFTPPDRMEGTSSWTIPSLARLFWSTFISFSVWPLRFLMLLGVFGIVFSAILTLITLYRKLFSFSPAGIPTVIILLCFFGSFNLLGLGIVGEYLSQVYEEVKRRPLYVIRDRLCKNAANLK